MHLRFGETESAFDYMMATREYLEQHGKPLRSTATSTAFSGSIMVVQPQPVLPSLAACFLNWDRTDLCQQSAG
jgi:hypothetical protein